MHGFIDIYSKLIIAIISFIAPVIVFLLSVFSNGIAILKRRAAEEKNQIANLLRTQMNGEDFDAIVIAQSNAALEKSEQISKRKLKLLDPKRQIIRIFSVLLSTLLLVAVSMLFEDQNGVPINVHSHQIWSYLLYGSFASFVVGLLILRQVAWAIINTKQIIADEEAAVTVGS